MARERRHREPSEPTVVDDLARWLAFGVLLGLFPLVFRFIYLRTQVPLHTALWVTTRATLGSGDLFLISGCIGSAALGERVGRATEWPRTEIFICLMCLFGVVTSMIFYGFAVSKALATGVVATVSSVLFIFTILTSAPLVFITLQQRHKR